MISFKERFDNIYGPDHMTIKEFVVAKHIDKSKWRKTLYIYSDEKFIYFIDNNWELTIGRYNHRFERVIHQIIYKGENSISKTWKMWWKNHD